MPSTIAEVSQLALSQKYSILPIKPDGTKRPVFAWEKFQKERATAQQAAKWFELYPGAGLAIIGGKVSGNAEFMDFDKLPYFKQFIEAAKESNIYPLVKRVIDGYCEKTPNGIHLLYRCTHPVEGNLKLARRPKVDDQGKPILLPNGKPEIETLIETRGEGGYAIIAPSNGKVHPSGKKYEISRGSIDTVVTITPEERELLLNLARTFDEAEVEPHREFEPASKKEKKPGDQFELRVGDDFNQRADWQTDILGPAGFSVVMRRNNRTFWKRPGKVDPGWSASTGNKGRNGEDVFCSYSSSVDGFVEKRGYGKFSTYGILFHNGDFQAAAKELAARGYGSQEKKSPDKKKTELPKPPPGEDPPPPTDKDNPNSGKEKGATTPPPANKPAIMNAADLLAKHFEPIKWIVPGIIPEGTSLFTARPKMGKSWLMLMLAIAVATGGRFLNFNCTEGEVLYLALEDNERRLKSRLLKLLPDGVIPQNLYFATAWPRIGEGFVTELEAWLLAHPNARFVVLDTLAKVKPGKGRNDSVYEADYNAMQGIKRLTDEYRFAFVAVFHNRKAESDDPMEQISGSFGLSGGVDNTWVMQRQRFSKDAILSIMGRDIVDKEMAVSWDGDLCQWVYQGEAQEFKISTERREILDAIKRCGPDGASIKEIAELTGKKYDNVRMSLNRMYDAGQVDRNERNKFLPGAMPTGNNQPPSANIEDEPF